MSAPSIPIGRDALEGDSSVHPESDAVPDVLGEIEETLIQDATTAELRTLGMAAPIGYGALSVRGRQDLGQRFVSAVRKEARRIQIQEGGVPLNEAENRMVLVERAVRNVLGSLLARNPEAAFSG